MQEPLSGGRKSTAHHGFAFVLHSKYACAWLSSRLPVCNECQTSAFSPALPSLSPSETRGAAVCVLGGGGVNQVTIPHGGGHRFRVLCSHHERTMQPYPILPDHMHCRNKCDVKILYPIEGLIMMACWLMTIEWVKTFSVEMT